MKCIKYISFSLLFFLIGIVGVKAESAEIICKYTIDCNQVYTKFEATVEPSAKTQVSVFKLSNNKFSFKIDGTDYVDVDDKGNTQFPNFCGHHNHDGSSIAIPVFAVQPFVDYFYKNNVTSSSCPDLNLQSPQHNAILAFGESPEDRNLSENDVVTFKPEKIATDEEITASGGFRCYYLCDGFNSVEDKYQYMIQYSNKIFNVEGVLSSSIMGGNKFADFSSELKSADNCPNTIYLNGYADLYESENYGKSLYFSKTKDRTGAQCKKISEKDYLKENQNNTYTPDYDIDLSGCIIDPGTREIIDWIMNLVRVGGIILLIVLGMLDFIKAAASGEQDEMKKSSGKFVKRLIACVALFLAPIFVDLILSLVNIAGGADEDCNSSPKPEVTEKRECWVLGASDCSKRDDCTWQVSSCKAK